jgi:hypothetical protein
MRFHGMSTWPPVWTNTAVSQKRDKRQILRGERGILKNASMNNAVNNICFLFVEHNGEQYAGALVVDDAVFCRQVFDILRENLERPIKEIGDLDLSRTL